MMRRVARFSGVEVLTYAVLDNHFHMLIKVLKREEISDDELLGRMRLIYAEQVVAVFAKELAACRDAGNVVGAEQLRKRYVYRMYSLPEFMKTLKQRYAMWFNATHQRSGRLWDDRYKSVLVEGGSNGIGSPGALWIMAQYIELNAVRAGIVAGAELYAWCGFAAALAGDEEAQKGICAVFGENRSWNMVRGMYGQRIAVGTEEGGGIEGERMLAKRRVRYFVDGVIMGSAAFVEVMFQKRRELFCASRKTAARKMRGADWGGLCTVRDFRKAVFGGGEQPEDVRS